MLKICLLLFTVVSSTVSQAYNYGENSNSGYNADPQPQQQMRTGSFLNNKPLNDQKWTNGGFGGQSSDLNQDGSYIIRPQLRTSTLQRNINFRSAEQQSNLRSSSGGNSVLSTTNTGFVNNDVATNERTSQRFLLPVSHASNLPKSDISSLSASKDVSANVPVQKNEASTSVQAGSAIPLLQLSRLRPQSHSSSPFYRTETLEQMLNRKSADKFLGPGFIQQQLISQKGEDKFLKVYGKEEREVNGTIELKNGLVNANLEETKDGKFSVMDRDNRKVGDVAMRREVEKHLKMTENNGITNVELEKNSNAELNVERDINLGPRRYGDDQTNQPNPSHKVRVHLEQNQNSRANVEITKNQVQKTTNAPDNKNNNGRDNSRFRRDTDDQLNNLPLNISSLQDNPFVKQVGSVLTNLGTKISNAMGTGKGRVCQVLVDKSEQYKTKLDQLENKPAVDLSKMINSNETNSQMSPEAQSKMKNLMNNLQKNTLKLVNSLTNRAIVILKNCTEVQNNEQIYNGTINTENAQVGQLPNGQNVIVVDQSTVATNLVSTEPTTTIPPS